MKKNLESIPRVASNLLSDPIIVLIVHVQGKAAVLDEKVY